MSFDAPLHSHIECEALQLCIGLKLLFTLSSFSPLFNRQRLSLFHSRWLNSASPIPWFQVWLWCWPHAEWVLQFPMPRSNSSDELVIPGGSTPYRCRSPWSFFSIWVGSSNGNTGPVSLSLSLSLLVHPLFLIIQGYFLPPVRKFLLAHGHRLTPLSFSSSCSPVYPSCLHGDQLSLSLHSNLWSQ
jgi:hypothetical protein